MYIIVLYIPKLGNQLCLPHVHTINESTIVLRNESFDMHPGFWRSNLHAYGGIEPVAIHSRMLAKNSMLSLVSMFMQYPRLPI